MKKVFALTLVVLLAACGGGGGGSVAPDAQAGTTTLLTAGVVKDVHLLTATTHYDVSSEITVSGSAVFFTVTEGGAEKQIAAINCPVYIVGK